MTARNLAAILTLALVLALWAAGEDRAEWAFDYPRGWELPLDGWIDTATDWLLNTASFGLFTFRDMTRAVSAVIEAPYDLARALLAQGLTRADGSPILPPLGWLAITALAGLIAHRAGGWGLAVLAVTGAVALAAFGQWASAMVTLASILVAVPLGVALGLSTGLAAHRWPAVARAITPLLDLMQTMPVFAYLVPILFMFGFGPTAADGGNR